MDINELESYRLSDAVKFHDQLNPVLWGPDEHLHPRVRQALLTIADNFREFLGVDDLEIQDITVSGSNAAYNYTDHSDVDLHLVVNMPNNVVYRELFSAKKYEFNDEHNIRIGPHEVELYVQDAAEPHVSQGIYSVRDQEWRAVPRRRRAEINDASVRHKYEDLGHRIEAAIESDNLSRLETMIDAVKNMRKAGLAHHGEFGAENLAFKLLRNQGLIDRLYSAHRAARDRELSLVERKKKKKSQPRKRWAYGGYWFPGYAFFGNDSQSSGDSGGDGGGESVREAALSSPGGVSASTHMFLSETDTDTVLKQFIQDTARRLEIQRLPRIFLHRGDRWSERRHSFGMYDPEQHELHVSLVGRHLLDILRTTAHELVHCRQHEIEPLPTDAGSAGSPFEDEAHAVAGKIMRDFADSHPELFGQELHEDITSLIPPGTARAIAGMCAAAGLSGCVTMSDLRTVQTLGRTVQSMERYGTAGAQEEVTQELKNYLRARQGDANAQNQSHIYRWERRQPQVDPSTSTGTRPLPSRIISREPQQEDYDPDHPPSLESKPTMPALLISGLQNALDEFKQHGVLREKCWTGYRQQGTKRKGQRQVPNCVPVSEGSGMRKLDQATGEIMREFNKQFPQYLKLKPVMLEKSDSGTNKFGRADKSRHCDSKNAVPELKAALEKHRSQLNKMSNQQVYDRIDKIMRRIAQTYDLTGQELHDMWVKKHGEIPDTWILDEKIAPVGPALPMPSQLPRRRPNWPEPVERKK
jgi:hypothetical protein